MQEALHAEMARQRDDRSALSRAAEALEERGRTARLTSYLAEAAVLWLQGRQHVRAARIVDRLSPGLADRHRSADWLLVVAKVCEAAAGSGRPSVAASCVDLLAPYAGRAVLSSGGIAFAGVVEDYLALATGDVAQADRARAAYVRIGADWWARRGPLARPAEQPETPAAEPRVLHLHPLDDLGPTPMWCIGREGDVRSVPAMQGLEYLRLLAERPGVDVPVLELWAAVHGTPVIAEESVLVDQQALTAYRRRVRELDEAIERAEASGDEERGERLGTERARLIAQARTGGMTPAQRGGTPRRAHAGRGAPGHHGRAGTPRAARRRGRPGPAREDPHRHQLPLRGRPVPPGGVAGTAGPSRAAARSDS